MGIWKVVLATSLPFCYKHSERGGGGEMANLLPQRQFPRLLCPLFADAYFIVDVDVWRLLRKRCSVSHV